MKRNDTIRIASGVLILGLGYLGFRSWQRKKLFTKIAEMIGPGSGADLSAYDEWWSVDYWKNPPTDGKPYLKKDEGVLNQWANQIHSSGGTFNDDEGAMFGVLRSVPDGVALSQLSDKFQKRHNEDLKEYVAYYYGSRDEQTKITSLLSLKPPFRITQ